MKTNQILLIGGIFLFGIWLYKRRPKEQLKSVNSHPPVSDKKEDEPAVLGGIKPIRNIQPNLELSQVKPVLGIFPPDVVKDYNTSKFQTVAPAKVIIIKRG